MDAYGLSMFQYGIQEYHDVHMFLAHGKWYIQIYIYISHIHISISISCYWRFLFIYIYISNYIYIYHVCYLSIYLSLYISGAFPLHLRYCQVSMLAGYERQAFQSGSFRVQGSVGKPLSSRWGLGRVDSIDVVFGGNL